ncbi:hypothetical protein [Mesorhizobium sp. CN2-181]|uniref:hypothetical protein n=1 Tax=Mesorhizobium yinganensis TaxID=3157707 RepID=UPI0032B83D49
MSRQHIVAAPYDRSYSSLWGQFEAIDGAVQQVNRFDELGAYKAARNAHADFKDMTITRRPLTELLDASGMVDVDLLDEPYGERYTLLCPYGCGPTPEMWCAISFAGTEIEAWRKVGTTPFYSMPVPQTVEAGLVPSELKVRNDLRGVALIPEVRAMAERLKAPAPEPNPEDIAFHDYGQSVLQAKKIAARR